ncbi:MAG: hypothetical protein V3S54_07665, partial [Woeseiaceae bacterium]
GIFEGSRRLADEIRDSLRGLIVEILVHRKAIARQAGAYSCNTCNRAILGGRTAPPEVRMHGI